MGLEICQTSYSGISAIHVAAKLKVRGRSLAVISNFKRYLEMYQVTHAKAKIKIEEFMFLSSFCTLFLLNK